MVRRHDHHRRYSLLVVESPPRATAETENPYVIVSPDDDPTFGVSRELGSSAAVLRVADLIGPPPLIDRQPSPATVTYAPIMLDDRSAGVVITMSDDEREWTGRELRVLSAIASMIGLFWVRAEAERALAHEAAHDRLTGLADRQTLADYLARLGSCPSEVNDGLIIVSVDEMTAVNSGFGEETGNQLLVAMARRLLRSTRQADLVARVDGDTFAVVARELAPADVMWLAERIHRRCCLPVETNRGRLARSVTVGVANSADLSSDDLLRQARAAVTVGKETGKNRVVEASSELQRQLVHRFETEMALRAALAADDGQILPHYQPEFDIVTGKLVGVEALVRWDRPGYGILAAGQFIGIAEESGLVVEIGDLLMPRVCKQAAAWRDQFPDNDLTVRINVSPAQLVGHGLIELVEDSLQQSGLPPSSLCLEVTEHVVTAEMSAAKATLEAIHNLGVQLALDDFGTGYSSMLQLKTMPFDYLKIDRSFVAGLANDSRDEALIVSVISLAQALGIEIVAEGVEEPEQLVALTRLGCRRAQGFLLAHPSPASVVDEMLATGWSVDGALIRAGWL